MSEFEDILVTSTGVGKGRWRTSKLGAWLFINDGYEGDNGETYTSKSKKGNPFMIKVHSESLENFINHLTAVKEKLASAGEGTPDNEDLGF